MESVTIKMDNSMLVRMEQSMKRRGYSTKTEFIREAIRDKLEDDEKVRLFDEFVKRFHGKARTKVSDKRWREIREEAFQQLGKDRGWDV